MSKKPFVNPLAHASAGTTLQTPTLPMAPALAYDYSQIAEEHRGPVMLSARRIKAQGQQLTESLVQIGEELNCVKERLGHGQFAEWLSAEFGMSDRAARLYMQAARAFAGKTEIISVLSNTAMMMLAAPSVPEEARQAVIEQAKAQGKSPKVAEIKATIAAHKPVTLQPAGVVIRPAPVIRPLSVDEVVSVIHAAAAANGDGREATWIASHFNPGEYTEFIPAYTAIGPAEWGAAYRQVQEALGLRRSAAADKLRQEADLKRQRIEAALRLWEQAIGALPAIGELVGYYDHEPVKRAVAPVLAALRANLP